MTLGRTAAGKIKIKTDGDAGLRAVECACCNPGPCGGCPLLDNVLSATSYSLSYSISNVPSNYFGSGAPCLTMENEIITIPGSSCGAWAHWTAFFLRKENGKCYVEINAFNEWEFTPTPILIEILGGEAEIRGVHNYTVELGCDYISPEACSSVNGVYFPDDYGAPPRCSFTVNVTLTIS